MDMASNRNCKGHDAEMVNLVVTVTYDDGCEDTLELQPGDRFQGWTSRILTEDGEEWCETTLITGKELNDGFG